MTNSNGDRKKIGGCKEYHQERMKLVVLVNILSADIYNFTRRMRLTEYFHEYNNASNPNQNNPLHNKSSWTPPSDRDSALNAYIDAIKHDISNSNASESYN